MKVQEQKQMSPAEALLAELEREAAVTRAILESVPESSYDWRPHEKGRSMAELCGHIASVPAAMVGVLGGESFDIGERDDSERPPTSREELLAWHDDAVRSVKEWLAGLGGRIQDNWRVVRGGEELMELPRVAAIRFFLMNHLYHHRGQLSAYLRAAGLTVPSVYGPTADVNPFEA